MNAVISDLILTFRGSKFNASHRTRSESESCGSRDLLEEPMKLTRVKALSYLIMGYLN